MTIKNDIITFTASDFDALTDFAKKAISELAKGSVPNLDGKFEDVFSRLLNDYITGAKDRLKSVAKSDPTTDSILSGLASADAAKLAEVEPLLVQLDAALKS